MRAKAKNRSFTLNLELLSPTNIFHLTCAARDVVWKHCDTDS